MDSFYRYMYKYHAKFLKKESFKTTALKHKPGLFQGLKNYILKTFCSILLFSLVLVYCSD